MRRSKRTRAPRPRETAAVTGVLFAVVVAFMFAVSYPAIFATTVAGAVGGAIVATVVMDSRHRAGRTRPVRVPGTDVTVEA